MNSNVVKTGERAPAVQDTTGQMRAQKEIEGAIIVAKQFPRIEQDTYTRILAACGRKGFADAAYYRFPRGGSQVIGASVNMARELARLWGNIRYGVDIVLEDDDMRRIRAWAWDAETNTYVSEEDNFAKLIYRKNKGWVVPDERDLRELTNRRGAICTRNCLLRLIPRDFVDDALEKCFETIKESVGTGKGRDEMLKKLVASFADYGVTGKDIAEKYEVDKVNELAVEDIADLRGIYKSMRDGISKKAEHFIKRGAGEKTGTVDAETGEVIEEGASASDAPALDLGADDGKVADPEVERLRVLANGEVVTAENIEEMLALLETLTGGKVTAKINEDISEGKLSNAAVRIFALYASRVSKVAKDKRDEAGK